MPKKPLRHSETHPYQHHAYLTGRSRKFMLDRLREIDEMSDKEYAALKADADKLKAFFQGKAPYRRPRRHNTNGKHRTERR